MVGGRTWLLVDDLVVEKMTRGRRANLQYRKTWFSDEPLVADELLEMKSDEFG